jgi:hypothetical protein
MTDAALVQVYRQIPSLDRPCPPGCGACCGILWPSQAENRNIRSWLRLRGRPFIDFLLTAGLDCPYLDGDKRCSIYPVRPFLCRILAAAEALPCPSGLAGANRPLKPPQSSYLYGQIYLRGKQKALTEKHAALIREVLRGAGMLL